MPGFVRTLTIALAALCILLIAAGLTVLYKLKTAGTLTPEKVREWVLTEEELSWLKTMRTRPPEKPAQVVDTPKPGAPSEDELLARIAERIEGIAAGLDKP